MAAGARTRARAARRGGSRRGPAGVPRGPRSRHSAVASEQAASVAYATADDTAAQPADYLQKSGTANFAIGETSKLITVEVAGDTLDEVNETFELGLSAPVNATIADGTGVGKKK